MAKWKYGKNVLAIHADPRTKDVQRDHPTGKVVQWVTVGFGCGVASDLHCTETEHRQSCIYCESDIGGDLDIERRILISGVVTEEMKARSAQLIRERGLGSNRPQGRIREVGTGVLGTIHSRAMGVFDTTVYPAGEPTHKDVALRVADGFLGNGIHRVTVSQFRSASRRIS